MKKKRKHKAKEFNLKGYIFGALRKIWRWHPERRKVLEIAKVCDTTLKGEWYTCSACDKIYPRKQVHIDHIFPVIHPEIGFTTWDVYIERLFVDHRRLQVLCKLCHKIKTQAENNLRRK